LSIKYHEIKEYHEENILRRGAKLILAPSVIRVFEPDTKDEIKEHLLKVELDVLPDLSDQSEFKEWFNHELKGLARVIKATKPDRPRIYPGYKWGHGTKVLTLYIREIVILSRYFTDHQVKRISPQLYAPLDGIVIKKLRKMGIALPFKRIKEIDSARKFHDTQDILGEVANQIGVPRVWIDDIWI